MYPGLTSWSIEPVYFILVGSYCGILTCVLVLHEDKMFWDSHFSKYIPQFYQYNESFYNQ